MSGVIYDAGVLIAAERNDRTLWADHRVRLEQGMIPIAPAAVIAQVSRSARQAQLRRLLRGCDVVELDEDTAGGSYVVSVAAERVMGAESARASRICCPYLASLFSPTPFTVLSSARVDGASVAIWRRVASWKIT